jgi:hypothetical protein
MSRSWWRYTRFPALLFSVLPPVGPPSRPSPPSRVSRRARRKPVETPAWKGIVQYAIASAFCLVFLGLLVLDPFLPDYDVPPLLYMVILVVIVFALPGSERIATVLINAIFRRKDDS